MVEEFMLLANISVAQKIYEEFPDCAMLRKHPAPPPSNYDILLKAAKSKVMMWRWMIVFQNSLGLQIICLRIPRMRNIVYGLRLTFCGFTLLGVFCDTGG